MIISKKVIPRRTMLRGLGAALALPLLDSMVPALASARAMAAPMPRPAPVTTATLPPRSNDSMTTLRPYLPVTQSLRPGSDP